VATVVKHNYIIIVVFDYFTQSLYTLREF